MGENGLWIDADTKLLIQWDVEVHVIEAMTVVTYVCDV